jgi:hypothetical protein
LLLHNRSWRRDVSGGNQETKENEMSKRTRSPFEHQRNTFSGVSSQVNNFATRGSVAGNNITVVEELGNPFGKSSCIINGYCIDPRYSRYRTMNARGGQCIIDGCTCVLKEIGGVKMWTLEGVSGAPSPSTVVENEDSESSDSSSTSFDDRVYRKWRRDKRARKERKKDNEAKKRKGAHVKVQEFLAVLSTEQAEDAAARKRDDERLKLIGDLD